MIQFLLSLVIMWWVIPQQQQQKAETTATTFVVPMVQEYCADPSLAALCPNHQAAQTASGLMLKKAQNENGLKR